MGLSADKPVVTVPILVLAENSEGFIIWTCDISGARSTQLLSRYVRLAAAPVPKLGIVGFAVCGGLFGRGKGFCLAIISFAGRETVDLEHLLELGCRFDVTSIEDAGCFGT